MSWFALFSFNLTISVWVSLTCKIFFGYHGCLRMVFWPNQFFRARINLKHSFILTALNSATVYVLELPPWAMKSNCDVYIYYFVWPAFFSTLFKNVSSDFLGEWLLGPKADWNSQKGGLWLAEKSPGVSPQHPGVYCKILWDHCKSTERYGTSSPPLPMSDPPSNIGVNTSASSHGGLILTRVWF